MSEHPSRLPLDSDTDREPCPAELAEIEAEWPVIEAELALVDAEIRALAAGGGPSALDRRRLRRAERRVLAARSRWPLPLFGAEGAA